MSPVHAIYENGAFRPLTAVDLPEHCEVSFVPKIEKTSTEVNFSSEGMDEIYEILGRRYSSGYTDTAERHNEHQP
jgi:predicted DNA-binding antitoxin AbrB/MazE fold protein